MQMSIPTRCIQLRLLYKYLFKLTDSLVWLPCDRCSFFHVTLITNTNNMSSKQQIAKENRITIVALAKEGYSYRKIAQKLKISKYGVTSTWSQYRETASFSDRRRSGRPRKTSKSEDQYIKLTCLRDRCKSSRQIAQELQNSTGSQVSDSLVKCRLIKILYIII